MADERLRGLYVIVDPEATGGRNEIQVARLAIEGGARLIQLRDKRRLASEVAPMARALQQLCRELGALFIVNDDVDLAMEVEAGGVHVGQNDMPVARVRRLVSPTMMVGCSTNSVAEARRAGHDGASYVAVGRLYPTGSKSDTRAATLETLREVKAAVSVPVCAIGGINESNIDDVIAAGADMVAVIAAVVAADDVRAAAQRLARRFD
jgi:thiamine-phosphate diphosphorylase